MMYLGRILALLSLFAPISYAEDTEFFLRHFKDKQDATITSKVHDLIEDKRGIIYVANKHGLLEYDGVQWRHIEIDDKNPAIALGTDIKGRVYVAGKETIGYLSPDRSGKMLFVSLRDKLSLEARRELQDHVQIAAIKDSIYFATEHLILGWNGEKITEYRLKENIYSMIGFKDHLYVSTAENGLRQLKDNQFKVVKGGEDFSAATFSISRDNRLVAGSLGHGILEVNIEGDQVSYHTLKKQDKTQFSGIHIAKVQVISPFVFVGTSGGGIKIFNSDSGENIELQPKYKEHLGPDIFALEADNRGRIWVGSTAGIFVLMDKASSSFLDEAKEQPQEFVAYIRSCTSLKDQSTVFGGAFFKELGGVQTLEASELNKPTLEFEKNSLRFSYSSSDLVNADIIEYQTYLEGFDQGWSDWSERTYREFTNLVWKDYTFHIRARRADGTVSKEAKFEFTILPPWYEQYWFYLLQLVILMIVFAIVVYVNGWTDPKRRKDRTKKLNNIIIGTIWGYSFSKIGVQGALWAFSGGAAFLAVITKVVMGIFLKPMQKKVEIKIVEYQINLVQKLQRRSRAIDKKVKKIKQFADQKVRPGCSVKKPKEATLLTAKNLSGRQGFSNRPKGFHSQRKAS